MAFVSEQKIRLDRAIERVAEYMEKVSEYRSTRITAAVAGETPALR
jgi:hypothetical protein